MKQYVVLPRILQVLKDFLSVKTTKGIVFVCKDKCKVLVNK